MKQSKNIAKIATVKKIEYILDKVCKTPEKKVTAAVKSLRSNDDCARLMRMFSEQNNDFTVESVVLEQYRFMYNKLYATQCNGLYSGTYQVLYNAKKQLLFLYVLMNGFSKKPVQSDPFIHVATNTFDFVAEHSKLGLQPIQLELFDNMDPVREGLIMEILRFLNRLEKNLQLCLEVVNEEKEIEEDLDRIMYIFENQLDDVFGYIKNTKKKRNTDIQAYHDLLDYRNHPEAVVKYFHKIGTDVFSDVVSGIKEKQLAEYSPLLRKTYAENVKKMDKLRFIVAHVDEAFTKITGELLCYIYKYTECEKSKASFLKCFEEEYRRIGGKQKIVSRAALSGGFTNSNKEGYEKVRSIIDNLYLMRPITPSANTSDSDSSSAYLQQ